MPFGEVRTEIGTITQTDFAFTGQRSISMLSIMDYNARFYDPGIGRFVQPDSIVPGGPQTLNRYTYASNSPIVFNDPSGHKPCWATAHYSCDLSKWNLDKVETEYHHYDKYSNSYRAAVVAFLLNHGLDIRARIRRNQSAGTLVPPLGSTSGSDGGLGNSSDIFSGIIDAGFRSPKIDFAGIDTGFWVISGSYQISISSNSESGTTVYNNGLHVVLLDIQINHLSYHPKFEGLPGMSIGLVEPGFSLDANSKLDLGEYRIEQTMRMNMEARIERLAALLVFSGSYEALLYLLTSVASNPSPVLVP